MQQVKVTGPYIADSTKFARDRYMCDGANTVIVSPDYIFALRRAFAEEGNFDFWDGKKIYGCDIIVTESIPNLDYIWVKIRYCGK